MMGSAGLFFGQTWTFHFSGRDGPLNVQAELISERACIFVAGPGLFTVLFLDRARTAAFNGSGRYFSSRVFYGPSWANYGPGQYFSGQAF